MSLRKGMDMATDHVVRYLTKISTPANEGDKSLEDVAVVATNGDISSGKLLADAFRAVTRNGHVTIEEAKSRESQIEIKEGMQINQGYISPFFISEKAKMKVILDKPSILLLEEKLNNPDELLQILNECAEKKSSLLIIAENIEGDALSILIINKLKGTLNVAGIKAPGFGEDRKETLLDIAAFTSGTVISEDTGTSLKSLKTHHLGTAEKVIIDKDNTIIIGNSQHQNKRVEEIVLQVKNRLEKKPSQYEEKKLKERLARLSGSVAAVKVGAITEAELKAKKERLEDALSATRAALEEGIIPGGGVAYIRSIQALNELIPGNEDERTGINIIRKCLEGPLRALAQNAGLEGSVVLQKVKEGKDDFGYNIRTRKYESLISVGVIDTTKAARVALQSAVSIAGSFLTIECAIAEEKVRSHNLN